MGVGGLQWPLLRPMAMLGGHLRRWQLSLMEMNGSNAPWPVFQRTSAEPSVWPKTPLHRIQFISHVPKSQIHLFSVIVFISAVALGRARTSTKDQQPASHVFWREMVPLSLWEFNYNQSKKCGLFKGRNSWICPHVSLAPVCSFCPSTHVTVGLVQLVVSDGVFLLLQRHVIAAGLAPNSKPLVLVAACKTLFEVMQLYLNCSIWGGKKKTYPMVGKFEED